MIVGLKNGTLWINGEQVGEFENGVIEPAAIDPQQAALMAGIDLGANPPTILIPLAMPKQYLSGELQRLVSKTRYYGPCAGCGNPAKDGMCFKCQTKAKNALKAVDHLRERGGEDAARGNHGRRDEEAVQRVREAQSSRTLEDDSEMPGLADPPAQG